MVGHKGGDGPKGPKLGANLKRTRKRACGVACSVMTSEKHAAARFSEVMSLQARSDAI